MGKTETIQVPIFTTDSPEYEVDFHAWLLEQASRLRLLRVPGIDTENLAEEIESLGRSDKRELLSRSEVLIVHLLKWRYQPDRQGNSWRRTIYEQRNAIEIVLQDSPSLRRTFEAVLSRAYPVAVKKTLLEVGGFEALLPNTCEWSPQQVLAEDFFPEA